MYFRYFSPCRYDHMAGWMGRKALALSCGACDSQRFDFSNGFEAPFPKGFFSWNTLCQGDCADPKVLKKSKAEGIGKKMAAACFTRPESLQYCNFNGQESADAFQVFAPREEIWITSHFPIYTFGPRSLPNHVAQARSYGASNGIASIETFRGGQVTFHGLGQCMIYPILKIKERGLCVREYIFQLLQWVSSALSTFSPAYSFCFLEPYTGLWTSKSINGEKKKIASLGVHFSRGVSTYGIALNIFGPLEPFSAIAPCGLSGTVMTTLDALDPCPILRDSPVWHPAHPVVQQLRTSCPWT